MYISRRGDTVGPPVWKSTILHVFSKSKLSILETMAVQAPTMYVEPSTPSYANSYRYLTMLSCTWYPSDIEHNITIPWLVLILYPNQDMSMRKTTLLKLNDMDI